MATKLKKNARRGTQTKRRSKKPAQKPAQKPATRPVDTATMPLQDHMVMAFGTPVVAYQWPDSDTLNAGLREVVLAAEARSAGVTKSNVGGWHSTTDLLTWDAPCLKTLGQRIRTAAIEMTRSVALTRESPRNFRFGVECWANVSRHGCYNTVHNHPNSLWSGTYYVCGGEPTPGRQHNGKLELLDPRNSTNMIHIEHNVLDGRYIVDPIPGLMILFPSWLNHLVHPFFGSGERISIAFNIQAAETLRGTEG